MEINDRWMRFIVAACLLLLAAIFIIPNMGVFNAGLSGFVTTFSVLNLLVGVLGIRFGLKTFFFGKNKKEDK